MVKKSSLDRVIRLGVLEHIQMAEDGLSPRDVADKLRDSAMNEHPQTKNVCAKLTVPLSDRIDSTVGWIGCSKRRFIELAITAALDRFDEIAEDEGLDDVLDWDSPVRLTPVEPAHA